MTYNVAAYQLTLKEKTCMTRGSHSDTHIRKIKLGSLTITTLLPFDPGQQDLAPLYGEKIKSIAGALNIRLGNQGCNCTATFNQNLKATRSKISLFDGI